MLLRITDYLIDLPTKDTFNARRSYPNRMLCLKMVPLGAVAPKRGQYTPFFNGPFAVNEHDTHAVRK